MATGFKGVENPSFEGPEDATEAGQRKLAYLPATSLKPAADNPRKHTREQIRAIAKSIDAFGFTAPILVDRELGILAGHGRLQAAELLGLETVPVIFLDHLTEAQALAYRMADNKLTDRSTWDEAKVAAQLKELTELALDFDIEATGFEPAEIDFRIQCLDDVDAVNSADEFKLSAGPAVSTPGNLWLLNEHRLFCGNALDRDAFRILMNGEKASAAFTDPPYNVPIDGHASGKGSIKHREFAMASGEMSEAEFTAFLTDSLSAISEYTRRGALLYTCMDWR
ncbi:MAG: ParB/Srx family N-terminal domain-containing protein, partial [Methylovirgula sp.]